ncbi:unnamed protein product [Auanema sp. JU1783]|nr:unnamed protein product [Auanema sp. JU1783]
MSEYCANSTSTSSSDMDSANVSSESFAISPRAGFQQFNHLINAPKKPKLGARFKMEARKNLLKHFDEPLYRK